MSFENYLEGLRTILNRIEREQAENIEQAGRLIADVLAVDGVIHTFGTGHSHLIVPNSVESAVVLFIGIIPSILNRSHYHAGYQGTVFRVPTLVGRDSVTRPFRLKSVL